MRHRTLGTNAHSAPVYGAANLRWISSCSTHQWRDPTFSINSVEPTEPPFATKGFEFKQLGNCEAISAASLALGTLVSRQYHLGFTPFIYSLNHLMS